MEVVNNPHGKTRMIWKETNEQLIPPACRYLRYCESSKGQDVYVP